MQAYIDSICNRSLPPTAPSVRPTKSAVLLQSHQRERNQRREAEAAREAALQSGQRQRRWQSPSHLLSSSSSPTSLVGTSTTVERSRATATAAQRQRRPSTAMDRRVSSPHLQFSSTVSSSPSSLQAASGVAFRHTAARWPPQQPQQRAAARSEQTSPSSPQRNITHHSHVWTPAPTSLHLSPATAAVATSPWHPLFSHSPSPATTPRRTASQRGWLQGSAIREGEGEAVRPSALAELPLAHDDYAQRTRTSVPKAAVFSHRTPAQGQGSSLVEVNAKDRDEDTPAPDASACVTDTWAAWHPPAAHHPHPRQREEKSNRDWLDRESAAHHDQQQQQQQSLLPSFGMPSQTNASLYHTVTAHTDPVKAQGFDATRQATAVHSLLSKPDATFYSSTAHRSILTNDADCVSSRPWTTTATAAAPSAALPRQSPSHSEERSVSPSQGSAQFLAAAAAAGEVKRRPSRHHRRIPPSLRDLHDEIFHYVRHRVGSSDGQGPQNRGDKDRGEESVLSHSRTAVVRLWRTTREEYAALAAERERMGPRTQEGMRGDAPQTEGRRRDGPDAARAYLYPRSARVGGLAE